MLQAIRGRAGSWIVKILFGLLILSFAAWGVGDIFSEAPAPQVVATVGEREIPTQTIVNGYQAQVDQIRQLTQGAFQVEGELRGILINQVVREEVEIALMDAAVADFGLQPSDDAVALMIRNQPAFRDPVSGTFQPTVFQSFLAVNGLSELGYVQLLRADLTRQLLETVVSTPPAVPETLVATLFAHRQEHRVVTAVSVDGTAFTDLPDPSELDLRAIYDENPGLFEAPEYRDLTVLTLTAEALAAEITVGDAEILDLYEQRIDEYTTTERREFRQAMFPLDAEAAAAAFVDAVRGGADFDAAITGLDIPAEDVLIDPIDWTEQSAMIPQELGVAGFDLTAVGDVSDPVASAFRLHVIQLAGLEAAGTRPIEEVSEELADSLRLERALDTLFELSNEIEDVMAGGGTLDEAAQAVGAEIVAIEQVAASGVTASETPLPDLPAMDRVIISGFRLDEGDLSRLEETDEGDALFLVRLDQITAPAVRPFDDVTDEAAVLWERQERQARAEAAVAVAGERLSAGANADAAADGAEHATAVTVEPLLRDGSNRGDLPRELVALLFDDAEIGMLRSASAGLIAYVARLDEIVPADREADADAWDQIADEVAAGLAADLRRQFLDALRARHAVSYDQEAIDALIASFGGS